MLLALVMIYPWEMLSAHVLVWALSGAQTYAFTIILTQYGFEMDYCMLKWEGWISEAEGVWVRMEQGSGMRRYGRGAEGM